MASDLQPKENEKKKTYKTTGDRYRKEAINRGIVKRKRRKIYRIWEEENEIPI